MEESDRIKALIKGETNAQKWLYDRFAPMVHAVCLRYLPTVQDAEDLTVTSLFRAMEKAGQYSGDGSFDAWIRRIAVRECLMFLRKNRLQWEEVKPETQVTDTAIRADERMQMEDLLALIAQLPDGYRTIFQLYEIEGYKHREIAELLDISIHTSKSQLIMAKKRLQELIHKNEL